MGRQELHQACITGDVTLLLNLIGEDDCVLDQKLPSSSHTALHFTARFGHVGLAAEILWLRPELVGLENGRLEMPLHEVCQFGEDAVGG